MSFWNAVLKVNSVTLCENEMLIPGCVKNDMLIPGELGTVLVAWLTLVQRLINTDSVINRKPEPPRQTIPDTFDYMKYLAVCQQVRLG